MIEMDESELRAEIVEQWGTVNASDDRYVLVDMLVVMSQIAWQSLAHPPNADQQFIMADCAAVGRTRSRQPRMVLRKLIERAQAEFGWVPTESVLRAAGKQVPR